MFLSGVGKFVLISPTSWGGPRRLEPMTFSIRSLVEGRVTWWTTKTQKWEAQIHLCLTVQPQETLQLLGQSSSYSSIVPLSWEGRTLRLDFREGSRVGEGGRRYPSVCQTGQPNPSNQTRSGCVTVNFLSDEPDPRAIRGSLMEEEMSKQDVTKEKADDFGPREDKRTLKHWRNLKVSCL